MPDDLDVLLEIVDGHAHLPGNFGHLMILEQTQVIGDDLLSGRAFEPKTAKLQQEALLQVAGGHARGVETLDQPERTLDLVHRPRPHGGNFFERRHQRPIVVQVADDGGSNLARQ